MKQQRKEIRFSHKRSGQIVRTANYESMREDYDPVDKSGKLIDWNELIPPVYKKTDRKESRPLI